ncbi:VOC family protein [Listeria costaricensis]|uniref:VOC family protein n=1 Tax=Listeria costaricensis TaxID=2026604 RepID=UPI000C06AF61|nr:VOC family protein [Listeria costaricensis]
MAITVPYLLFDGEANEALSFYKEAFGATEAQIQRFQDSEDFSGDAAEGKRLIHGRLAKNGEEILYFSDTPLDSSEPLSAGNQVSIAFKFATEAELRAAFEKLKIGGQVHMELQETFWGALYASLADKYGIIWQLNWYKD